MVAAVLVAAACAGSGSDRALSGPPRWVDDTSLRVRLSPGGAPAAEAAPAASVERYRDVARKIIEAARADRGAFEKLRYLTDRIGHRLSGSAELDAAIAWAAKAMRDDGHDVRTEEVLVPHWVRGPESGQIVAPRPYKLRLIGLGGTVPTPRGGVTAPVVAVSSWEELERRKAEVKGAIVLYDVAMPAWTPENGSGYGDVVPYRWSGAIEAAKRGAVAVLMRSVTAHSLATPHTGSLGYDDAVPKIAAAAVAVEDATLLRRLAADGKVTVKLELQSKTLPDVKSANVIGELRGKEWPDQIVVIGAHLDSWDVGQGAHDDGAGCVTMMQALTTLRRLGLAPRRTIRVVLYTAEENGVHGGKGYAAAHAAELGKHVVAIESDSGGFTPVGFDVDATDAVARSRIRARVSALATLLAPLGAMRVEDGHSGADVDPLVKAGVPGLGLRVDNRTYFDIHHTEADTLDKVDPAQLAADVAAVAAVAYAIADLDTRLDAP